MLHVGVGVKNYRLYRIDGDGRIGAAEWLEAADDQSAGDQAARLCGDGGTVELWARDRLVARLGRSARQGSTDLQIDPRDGAQGAQPAG